MAASVNHRLLVSVLVVLLSGLAVALVWVLARDTDSVPDIQGRYVISPEPLPEFALADHRGGLFTREDLLGDWHFVSYGFTHCPDICPMTLSVLAQLDKKLADNDAPQAEYLFYSVDHERDTVDRLSDYVRYFNEDFIGLTVNERVGERHRGFERGLDILYEIEPRDSGAGAGDDYQVNHGVLLYLINPKGELQAIFEPSVNERGYHYFSVARLYRDYLAVREHIEPAGEPE